MQIESAVGELDSLRRLLLVAQLPRGLLILKLQERVLLAVPVGMMICADVLDSASCETVLEVCTVVADSGVCTPPANQANGGGFGGMQSWCASMLQLLVNLKTRETGQTVLSRDSRSRISDL